MNAAMESAPKREDNADVGAFIAAHEAYWDGVSAGGCAILSRAARLANDAAVRSTCSLGVFTMNSVAAIQMPSGRR